MKRWFLLILTLFFACTPNPAEKAQEVVIGVFGSMTGTTATFGQSTRKGVEMATAELNAKGGLLGKKIRLVIEDDQGKPEEAQTVATKLVNKDRVVAMIGETASSRSLAAAPVCQQAGIPMVSPSSTNPKVTQAGDYIFRVCFIDPFQGQAMARFAAETLKLKKVAILRDIKNDYSVGLADVFANNFKKLGGDIVSDQSYGEGDTDFSAQLTSIHSSSPEAVFVPGYYTEVGLIARQARKLGITVPLLGGDGWESPKLWEIGGEAINGCFYTNHYSLNDPNPSIQNFVKAYRSQFQETPDAVGALSYDAMRILAAAITKAGTTDGPRIRQALASTKDFAGVTGNITLDANRNAVKPAVVLRIQDGKLEFVQRVNP
ncbi:MAG TPA: ABC transporter substrate-binding protein [Acidobacteriota bacterium]|nr:ABC transporter substrate-binding protein [Acidobacteriota bacterium]